MENHTTNFSLQYTWALVFVVVLGLVGCGGSSDGVSPRTQANALNNFDSQDAALIAEQTGSTVEEPTVEDLTVAETVEEPPEQEITTGQGDSGTGSKLEPSINLAYPENGAVFSEGSAIVIGVDAWDDDGTVEKVTFYSDNNWIGRDETPPYEFSWQDVGPGNYKIFAMAHDNNDLTTKSMVLSISVAAQSSNLEPKITLTAPGDASEFTLGTNIVLKADASDSDGTVSKVDFYSDGKKLASDAAAPYEHTWAGAEVGDHEVYAVATDNNGAMAASVSQNVSVATQTVTNTGTLVTYPASGDISVLHKSNRFGVKVTQNGSAQESFVYKEDNNGDPTWDGTFDYMQNANHWTTFSFAGSVAVEARRLDGQDIKTCVIRPQVLKIEPKIQGSTCTFNLAQPVKVSVEIDENYELSQYIEQVGDITKKVVKHPLFVFADPLEESPPSAGDKDVLYFGPGIHEIGKRYSLANNTHVYLAGGSYVIGSFVTKSENPKGITIDGRGILSGDGLTESASENEEWSNHAIDFTSGSNGKDLLIEGITITNPLRGAILSYNTTEVRNVKLFSWRHRNDGIGVGDNSIIEDSFIKVQDDNIKLYYSNQVIRNNVVWQQNSGAVFKFAWDLKRVAENNSISNIDIIHSDVYYDYPASEPDRPEMQSTSAVFSAMGFNKNAAFKNSTFQWIRIEEEYLLRLISLRMVSTHETATEVTVWGDPNESASKLIDNVSIKDITLAGVPYKESTFYGNKGGVIKNVTISNLKVGGQTIANSGSLTSRLDGNGISTAGNVSNVVIE